MIYKKREIYEIQTRYPYAHNTWNDQGQYLLRHQTSAGTDLRLCMSPLLPLQENDGNRYIFFPWEKNSPPTHFSHPHKFLLYCNSKV